MLHLSSSITVFTISRIYQTIIKTATTALVVLGVFIILLDACPGCTMPPRRLAYYNPLSIKNQELFLFYLKKLQAAEHLRTQRPENMINYRDPSRVKLSPHAPIIHPPRILSTVKNAPHVPTLSRTRANWKEYTACPQINNQQSTIKHQKFKNPGGAVHLPAGAFRTQRKSSIRTHTRKLCKLSPQRCQLRLSLQGTESPLTQRQTTLSKSLFSLFSAYRPNIVIIKYSLHHFH